MAKVIVDISDITEKIQENAEKFENGLLPPKEWVYKNYGIWYIAGNLNHKLLPEFEGYRTGKCRDRLKEEEVNETTNEK